MRATAMVAGAMLVAALLPVVVARSAPIPPTTGPGGAPQALSPADTLARIGPRFEANQGQLDPAVRFVSRAPGYSLFLTADGVAPAAGHAARLPADLAAAKPANRAISSAGTQQADPHHRIRGGS